MDPLSLVITKTALTETGLLLSHHASHVQKAGGLVLFALLSLAAWFYSLALQVWRSP